MRPSVDFLTLTATPIPRTLQLSFLGLKDISFIKTTPPNRQSIKTHLIRDDMDVVVSAIKKEVSRGGQVFIVHNRIKGMEKYKEDIQKKLPFARMAHAHGRLSRDILEKTMMGFYTGRYDILISTSIIESGLDIPNANTMIIHNAHAFGLAQLHQLRGRIGRGERKACVYFMIPSSKADGDTIKRFKALQGGSGFDVAVSDLESRGAGDILGASQSGHIESIGLEMYMELLEEAVREIKGGKKQIRGHVEIATPFEAFIPDDFIPDPRERLRQYKCLANCTSLPNLAEYRMDLTDAYGNLPRELETLFIILTARITLQYCGIESIRLTQKSIAVKFSKEMFHQNKALKRSVFKLLKKYEFTQDYRLVHSFENPLSREEFLSFCQNLAQDIVLC